MSTESHEEALSLLLGYVRGYTHNQLVDMIKSGHENLANAIQYFRATEDEDQYQKIFEQISTLLPMNKVHAVAKAIENSYISMDCEIEEILATIAGVSLDSIERVKELIHKLGGLSVGPCKAAAGILSAERRSHEEMVERMEKLKQPESSSAIVKPSVIFVIALRNEKRNNYYNWEYFLSKSRYEKTEYPEKRPIIFTWSCLKEHVENIHANLKDDTTIMTIEKYYGLNKRLTRDESMVIERLVPKPNAWAVHDNAISEPLWLDENRAQEASVRLAELLKE